jgi:dTDP-4-amino-4,6-dideoxygalactose transaminase
VSDPRLHVLPPLPPSVYLRTPQHKRRPFPLGEPEVALYSRARHGIYAGLRQLGLRPGDEALVPAYHHGSEVEALVRAGLSCRFYEGTERLEPDERELERLLGPRVRLLHLTHYVGFPQDATRWRSWCNEHGLLLLEDAAQAWLAALADGSPAGSLGDIAAFCLYKTVGVPDGAAVRLRDHARRLVVPETGGPGVRATARRHAVWLLSRSDAFSKLTRQRTAPYDATRDFALGDPDRGPLALTLRLLPRLATVDAAAARRANYRRLLPALAEHTRSPFDDLPPGASPFCFPVETEHKGEVLRRLRRAGIAAIDFWSVPHASLPVERFPHAARRRSRTVALPVHQELRAEDVARIAAAAAAALAGAPRIAAR